MTKSQPKRIAERRMENAKSRKRKLIQKKCKMSMIVQKTTMISLKVNRALALTMMNLVKRIRMAQMRI